ncbi:MAG: TetR family transcriptional regulator [Marmoricola sp.]|nr:TetR family transcriptional regulator [Marmoricola sp.]
MSRPGTYPKGVAKRAEILRVALEVFAREGMAGSSLRTIAKESGLSLTGLMHYFPSRDDLLTEVLREVDDRAEAAYAELGATIDVGDYLARVMDVNAAEPARVTLYVALLVAATEPGHPAAAFFADRFVRLREVIAAMVVEKRSTGGQGGLSDLDPDFVAAAIVAAADGIQNQWLHDRSIDMGAHVRRTWELLTGP